MRISGHILGPGGFVTGSIELARGTIASVEGEPIDARRVRDTKGVILLPGFVDLHVHGAGGRDIMEGGDATARVAAIHARHGTTSLLATTMTAPEEDLAKAFAGIAAAIAAPTGGAARVHGVHLEGPFINAGQLGAQPDFARPLAVAELERLHAVAPIKVLTVAPELPGHLETIEVLAAKGFLVQLGHSLATYEEGVAALSRGARGFTHLFNAMTAMHHRKPGLVGAALAHAEHAELIVDLLHLHPGAVRAALRAIPRAYCVTDSTSATGMPDGDYALGRHTVTKCMGGVRLADGTLAGSVLTMDQALRNLVDAMNVPLDDAARRVSTWAAEYAGLSGRGRLEVGAWADLVILDHELSLLDVLVEGISIEKGAP